MSQDIISFQAELCPAIPRVKNNKEFTEYCRLLERIDFILRTGGIDFEVATTYLEHVEKYVRQSLKPAAKKRLAKHAVRAMRCNILRHYLDESFIGLSRRIAERWIRCMMPSVHKLPDDCKEERIVISWNL